MKKILLFLALTTAVFAQQTINDLTVKDLKVVSTVKGSKPCPLMTEAQRNALVSPIAGQCVFNTTSAKLNVHNGTIWKSAGGGIDSWTTGFSYALNDLVIESNKIYICLIAHTSGTFATDLAALKWSEVSQGPLTTADLPDSLNKRYVTDANLTLLGLTSGTNTGDNSANSLYSGLATSKQDTLISATNIKTINGSSVLGAGDLTVTGANLTGDVTSVGAATTYNNIVPTTKGGTGLSTVGTESQVLASENGTPKWKDVPSIPKNYITANDGAVIGAWTTFADGTGSTEPDGAYKPVDGTGGASTATFAVSTDSSISGTSNFLFTHTAASNAGNGFSYDFTIDPNETTKVLRLSFDYKVASGTYADDGLRFWIYDVTNATLIQPAPYKLKNSGIIESVQPIEFQATTSTSYRLIAVVANATATAYTIRFDNFKLGKFEASRGSAITDWVAFTPSTNWTTVTNTGRYRRNGDSAEIQYKVSLTGTPVGTLELSPPNGIQVDTNKLVNNVVSVKGEIRDISVGVYDNIAASYNAGIFFLTYTQAGSLNNNLVSATTPTTFVSGDSITITIKVPIVGWSSSQVMSSDADTRVFGLIVQGTPAASTNNTPVIFPTTTKDTHSCYSSGRCTIKSSGFYSIQSTLVSAEYGAATEMYVYADGVSITPNIASGNSTGRITGSATVYLIAGQIVDIRTNTTSATGLGSSYFSLVKSSGPAQIQASQIVSFSANTSTTAATTSAPFIYTVKDHDTHNAYSTVTGKFTAPMAGIYKCEATGYSSATAFQATIYKNTTAVAAGVASVAGSSAATTTYVLSLLSGETVEVRPGVSATANGGATSNIFSCFRLGGI